MDIVTRAEAKVGGLNRYFTGVPCKNGHVDFRYTASGACKSCLAANNGRPAAFKLTDDPEVLAAKAALDVATAAYSAALRAAESRRQAQEQTDRAMRLQAIQSHREEMGTAAADVKARQEAKAQLVQAKFRMLVAERDTFATSVWASAVMRYPVLTLGDVDPHLVPQGKEPSGTAMFSFWCHPDDVEALRLVAYRLIQSRPVNVAAARQAAFGDAGAVPIAPVPDWARTPRPGDPDYK